MFPHSDNSSCWKKLTWEGKAQAVIGKFSSEKYGSVNWLYQGAELYQPGLNLRPAMKLRKVFTMGKIKSSLKVSKFAQSQADSPGPVNSNTKSKP